MKIYTKTGDKGTSALFTGERRAKDDVVFDALGTTDELSSFIGLAREYCKDEDIGIEKDLEWIQCMLQDIGSNIATPRNDEVNEKKIAFTQFDDDGSKVAQLEHWIDQFSEQTPPLKNFILPSGGKSGSSLHVARSVCRRAERSVVPLVQEGQVDQSVAKFLNRLSDYFFASARYASHKSNQPEVIYRKEKGKKKE
ncbi:hypothetical protein CONCODRAFT_38734 [Conidiobolus coronatus NRRL 28638]|uniref:Corrinoid adenosyltransferase MMAB n=1 Tax=Conidiobolus coronatus (strain ATCC 28846 / CBS 209.66 / NRRL 28638) TaxID=796925 RepID=A0A137P841_CONC2|nr:hypothetical protein CONCODRAFT_38734 [Conidiobolus coronatus NRRL 28638]|eukprot:KXN71114.1 hypothetical protein CONCODRAFT_38734 [Conidiobolus coronatus NRRL 28638]